MIVRREPFPLCEGKSTVSARLPFRDYQHCASLAQRLRVLSMAWWLISLCIPGKVGLLRARVHEVVAALGRMVRWRPLASPPGVHRQERSPRRNMGDLLPRPRRAACHASACRCCRPAVSASSAKTSAQISRTPSNASRVRQRSPRHERHLQQAGQDIKGSLVNPQRAFACVQSSGLEGALEAWKIVVPFALGSCFVVDTTEQKRQA